MLLHYAEFMKDFLDVVFSNEWGYMCTLGFEPCIMKLKCWDCLECYDGIFLFWEIILLLSILDEEICIIFSVVLV